MRNIIVSEMITLDGVMQGPGGPDEDRSGGFEDGPIPAAFTLTKSTISPGGVIFANYKRAGEVKTGNAGA